MADWDWSIPGLTDPADYGKNAPPQLTIPDAIKAGMDNLKANAKAIIGSVGGAEAASAGVTRQVTAAANNKADAETQIQSIEAIGQQKTIKDNASTAAMLGTQAGAASELISQYAQNVKPKMAALYDVQNKLEGMDKATPFSDPLSWIVNSFTRPFVEKQADRLEHDIGVDKQMVSNIQQVSEAAMRDNAIDDTVDATLKIGANAKLNKAQADITAANALHEQISQNLQGANIRLAANNEEFDSIVKSQQAAISQQAIFQNGAELKQKEALQQIETEKAGLMLKQESERQDDISAAKDAIAKGSAILGMGPISLAQFKLLDRDKQEVIMSAASSPVPGAVSFNPARALTMYEKAGIAPQSVGMARTLGTMERWVSPTISELTFKSLTPEAQVAKKSDAIRAHADMELKNIPQNSEGMYSLQPLNKVLGLANIIDLPLAKEMAPLAADPMHSTKADDFLAVTNNLLDGKKITVADAAAQMNRIFVAAATDNNTVRNYTAFSLKAMDVTNLPMSVVSPVGRGNVMLNMGDPAAIKNYLLKAAAQRAAQKAGLIENFPGVGMRGNQ